MGQPCCCGGEGEGSCGIGVLLWGGLWAKVERVWGCHLLKHTDEMGTSGLLPSWQQGSGNAVLG